MRNNSIYRISFYPPYSVKNQQLQGIELPVLMKGTTGFNG